MLVLIHASNRRRTRSSTASRPCPGRRVRLSHLRYQIGHAPDVVLIRCPHGCTALATIEIGGGAPVAVSLMAVEWCDPHVEVMLPPPSLGIILNKGKRGRMSNFTLQTEIGMIWIDACVCVCVCVCMCACVCVCVCARAQAMCCVHHKRVYALLCAEFDLEQSNGNCGVMWHISVREIHAARVTR